MSAEVHDLDNTVIAILDRADAANQAVADLHALGYEVEVLEGQSGREHLDPPAESGAKVAMKKAARLFGDRVRTIQRLDDALSQGKTVVSVKADTDTAAEAARVLGDHGAHDVWRFGVWTQSSLGS